MPNPRRDFLGWLGASTVLAAGGAPLAAMQPRHRSDDDLVPVTADWDVSWTDRVNGKHKAVFDSPEMSEGMALYRAIFWRDQYKEVYGTAPEEMSAVLVIRHAAIALAMDDSYWARFPIGKNAKMKDPATKKWVVKNPIRTTSPDTPPRWQDYSLERFMANGNTVLACNLAFQEVVHNYRTKDKLSREDAVKVAKEHLIPGVILQPSGIFACLRAQQAGCAYMMAS